MGLLERSLLTLAAITLLIGCGGSDAGTAESLTIPPDPAAAQPAPQQFGPIADFGQGVNELDVPRRVFLIVDGSDASAFDRKDPNNGCVLFAVDEQLRTDFAIADPDVQFFDQCHGHAYGISGQPVLCPGSRTLRQIEIDVVEGMVTFAGMNIDPNEPAALGGSDCPDTVQR